MYVIVAEFKIKPDQVEAFGQLIDRQARDSLEREATCHQFDVCQAEDDPSRFLLYEIYRDKAAFEAHRTMPHTTQFLSAAGPMVAERSLRRFNLRPGRTAPRPRS